MVAMVVQTDFTQTLQPLRDVALVESKPAENVTSSGS